MDERTLNIKKNIGTNLFSLMQKSTPEKSSAYLMEQVVGLRNSGNPNDEKIAKELEDQAKFIETNPEAAKISTGMGLADLLGHEKFKAMYDVEDTKAKTNKSIVEAKAKDLL